MTRKADAFCIYIDTSFQGPVAIERDEHEMPVVYPTREEAEREIAEVCIERPRQFLAGERDFADAITVEEYVVPVTMLPAGAIIDEDGNIFPREGW